MDEKSKHSEELFEVLRKNKKKRRRKVIRTVLTVLLILVILAVAGVSHLRAQVQERFAAAAAAVESYSVSTGTIHTVVSGTGAERFVGYPAAACGCGPGAGDQCGRNGFQ